MRIQLVLCAAALSLAAQEVPRPEYPQPQFQRETWQTLNGRWEFEYDDKDPLIVYPPDSSLVKRARDTVGD